MTAKLKNSEIIIPKVILSDGLKSKKLQHLAIIILKRNQKKTLFLM